MSVEVQTQGAAAFEFKKDAARAAREAGQGYFYWRVPCAKCQNHWFYVTSMYCVECSKRRNAVYYRENKELASIQSSALKRGKRKVKLVESILMTAAKHGLYQPTGNEDIDNDARERIKLFAFDVLRQHRHGRLIARSVDIVIMEDILKEL